MILKSLKLHHKSNLIRFVDDCNRVLAKVPYNKIFEQSLADVQKSIEAGNVREVWRMYSGNKSLWEDGYSVLLSPEVRLTFLHYRDLSAKEQDKALSKKLKVDK